MVVVLKKSVMTFILVSLSIWVVRYGIQWQRVDSRNYRYTPSEINDLKDFADAWVDYGLKAWYENQLDLACDYFRNALAVNVLHVDAWLDLARTEAFAGNFPKAGAILKFTVQLTGHVVKWKWPQLLLARDLGAQDIFFDNINFIIAYPQLQTDALNLLDLHVGGDTPSALRKLSAGNLPAYLKWLIRWKRPEDSLMVWAAMSESRQQNDNLYEPFVNFLVSQHQMKAAIDIWKTATGSTGLTHPGFESPFSKNAFDWSVSLGKFWNIQRDRLETAEGNYALRVDFYGKENINFAHVRQISPVQPGADYQLTFRWRARNLTTDQRPYIEVRGVQCKTGAWKSDMAPADSDWQEETILFTAPESCLAVSVTLRRNSSRRFGSKINGRLWLDDFHLEPIKKKNSSGKFYDHQQ